RKSSFQSHTAPVARPVGGAGPRLQRRGTGIRPLCRIAVRHSHPAGSDYLKRRHTTQNQSLTCKVRRCRLIATVFEPCSGTTPRVWLSSPGLSREVSPLAWWWAHLLPCH